MPILTIRHVTSYHYKRPVAFGEHRMMLHPRDDGDQKVLESELIITPEPSQLSWTRDNHGNHVATARFAERACELRFESTIHLDHAPARFRAADIRILPARIRLPTRRKTGPASPASSRRDPRIPVSIAGPTSFCARTDRPKLTSFSWT